MGAHVMELAASRAARWDSLLVVISLASSPSGFDSRGRKRESPASDWMRPQAN
jgi:hypothetical protein